MASDWIKMRTDLHDETEVRVIARESEVGDPFAVVGRLHRIWGWADRQTADGAIKGATFADIDDLTRTPGFAAAMCKAGWLVSTKTGIKLPHFRRHNGQSAKRRAEDVLRKRVRRSSATVRTNNGQIADQSTVQHSTVEKSREEQRNARIPSNRTSSEASTHAVPGASAGGGDACVAPSRYKRELLRVADAIKVSPISPRRRGSIVAAAMKIAEDRNPMPIWKAICKRAEHTKNPGGYIANAMAAEASGTQ